MSEEVCFCCHRENLKIEATKGEKIVHTNAFCFYNRGAPVEWSNFARTFKKAGPTRTRLQDIAEFAWLAALIRFRLLWVINVRITARARLRGIFFGFQERLLFGAPLAPRMERFAVSNWSVWLGQATLLKGGVAWDCQPQFTSDG